jgi:heme/copper-type cytochrome/quinol oxidase subunit 1
MSSAAIASHENYLSSGWDWRSWLTTLDHKRIGILYTVTITLLFGIGGAAAAMIRLDLLTPHSQLVSIETYNKLFTMHGVIMVWFFLIPSIPATLGNFLVPMMVGARDLAFPRLNLQAGTCSSAAAFLRSTRCWPAAWTQAGLFTRRIRRRSPTRTSLRLPPACSSPASPRY